MPSVHSGLEIATPSAKVASTEAWISCGALSPAGVATRVEAPFAVTPIIATVLG